MNPDAISRHVTVTTSVSFLCQGWDDWGRQLADLCSQVPSARGWRPPRSRSTQRVRKCARVWARSLLLPQTPTRFSRPAPSKLPATHHRYRRRSTISATPLPARVNNQTHRSKLAAGCTPPPPPHCPRVSLSGAVMPRHLFQPLMLAEQAEPPYWAVTGFRGVPRNLTRRRRVQGGRCRR